MAAVQLVGGCAHALCKEALQIGMNRAVILADDVPAWFRFPGGSSDSSCRSAQPGRRLRNLENSSRTSKS
jgi:hypothetical protein